MSYSPRTQLGRLLDDAATPEIPDSLDLWPAIAAAARRMQATDTTPDERAMERQPWSGPAVDPTATRRQRQTTTTSADAQEHSSMNTTTDATQEPIPLQQRRWTRDILKLAAALAVFIAIGAILALVLRDDDDAPLIVGPGPTPTHAPSPTVAAPATPTALPATATVAAIAPTATTAPTEEPADPTPTTRPAVEVLSASAEIEVGSFPQFPAFGSGAVWVPNNGDGSVSRIDPATNSVVATIATGSSPLPDPERAPYMVAEATDDAVWVSTFDEQSSTAALVRIDPATNEIVLQVPLEAQPLEIVYEPVSDSLWLIAPGLDVLRLDAASGEVVARVATGAENGSVATLNGLVWVSQYSGGATSTITVIDPVTNQIAATIEDVPQPRQLAGGEGALWVTTDVRYVGTPSVLRIDPDTREIVADIAANDPGYIAAGAGGVWFGSSQGGRVYRIDPASNTVVAFYSQINDVTFAIGDGTVWATQVFENVLTRIDP